MRTAALVLLLVPASASAQEVYAPRDGRFAITFPGKPKENSQTARTDLGSLKIHTATFATADGSRSSDPTPSR